MTISHRNLETQSKERIIDCYRSHGNISMVAKELGVPRSTLYNWMSKDGIELRKIKRRVDLRTDSKKSKKKRKSGRKITTANQFIQWLKEHPDHIYSKYFLNRTVNNPRKPDLALLEKIFSVLNEAEN